VGGSGLYVWGVLKAGTVPRGGTSMSRSGGNWKRKPRRGRGQTLYQELKQIDPLAASKIDPRMSGGLSGLWK